MRTAEKLSRISCRIGRTRMVYSSRWTRQQLATRAADHPSTSLCPNIEGPEGGRSAGESARCQSWIRLPGSENHPCDGIGMKKRQEEEKERLKNLAASSVPAWTIRLRLRQPRTGPQSTNKAHLAVEPGNKVLARVRGQARAGPVRTERCRQDGKRDPQVYSEPVAFVRAQEAQNKPRAIGQTRRKNNCVDSVKTENATQPFVR